MRRIAPILLLSMACCSSHPAARHWPIDPRPAVTVAETGEAGGASGESTAVLEEELKNIVGLFGGYTTERGEGGATVGLEYERRINSWLGVGAFGEVIAGDHAASAFGAGVYLRPTAKAAFVVMPGVEFERGESAQFMTRVGAIYDLWKSGRTILVPAVYVDLFRGRAAFVVGVSLAWEF